MKYLKAAGGFVISPFGVALILFVGLFILSNLFRIIPGPYSIVDNRIAAFEVDKVAELLIDVAWAVYVLFVHKTDNFKWVAAKIVVALILVLQAWDVANRMVCKVAMNDIVAGVGEWSNESAKGLCARTIGNGPIITEIVVGFLIAGWILWRYLKAQTQAS